MRVFEWDEAKNDANLEKHKLSFEDAVAIFEEPVLSQDDVRFDYGERRTVSIGRLVDVAVVIVVHTDRDGRTRVISARAASRRERALYDDHIR